MADFKKALNAMWDNEEEIWGRKVRGILWKFRVKNSVIETQKDGTRQWRRQSACDISDQEAVDWFQVEPTKTETEWHQAWRWAKKNHDRVFWKMCGDDFVPYKWEDNAERICLLEVVRGRWFIPDN